MNFLPNRRVLAAALISAVTALQPLAGAAETDRPKLVFSSQSNPFSFGLGLGEGERRFTFGDFGESRGEKALRTARLSLGGIPGEVGQLLSFPVRKPGTTALFLLGVSALISVDRQTTAFWQDEIVPVFDGIRVAPLFPRLRFIPTESQYLVAGLGLSYAGGIAFNDERSQTAALLAGKAIAYSYLTSQLILKPLFGRLRPVDNLSTATGPSGVFTTDPWQFGYSNGIPFTPEAYGTAMPSFHLTQYFAVARVYAEVYDNNVIPYLAAAAMTAVNIRGHRHWVSDMVAGATIGIGIGALVVNNYETRKEQQDRGLLLPVVSRNSVGFSYSMEF